jgi:GH15 family glucan-1,4-alpha-glucosidase
MLSPFGSNYAGDLERILPCRDAVLLPAPHFGTVAMSTRIEDYALIGDCQTGALVSRDGSIDWLCLPRFDSGACFAGLLGTCDHGRWQIRPVGEYRVTRHYREDTLILETEFTTADGSVSVIDFMPPRMTHPHVARIVVGKSGRVPMNLEFVIRPDYGSLIPWVQRFDGGIRAIAGPDGFHLTSDVELHGENFKTVADFEVEAGKSYSFVMTWFPSHMPPPDSIDAKQALDDTEEWWRCWTQKSDYKGRWRDAVMRSLITLKGLTYGPTGGIVAALTTSLPELIGGSRNWDYRYCWPRDAAFTLFALLQSGYVQEAAAWRDWLLRAVAGSPAQIQSIYGVAGEHRLQELELPWLPGYENSLPVRIGNGAFAQLQIDVYGELMAALYLARKKGLPPDEDSWPVQRVLMEHLESIWTEPDEGIWEIRGPRQHFTHSKVLAWVAADRAVKTIELMGWDEPTDRWFKLRNAIHDDVCQRGFDPKMNSFVQAYGSGHLDASLLVLPLVGFLPPNDPRIIGTLEAVQRVLMDGGLLQRYDTASRVDGLHPGEGKFLLCSFWLVDNLTQQGRYRDALELFERLLSLRNDVGLLSEEYEPVAKRMVGNFPQALSHVAMINSAQNLSAALENSDGVHKSYEQCH